MKINPCNIYKLKGAIQHYAWGGYTFIPQLLGIDNTSQQPYAEYWMGAHVSAPSTLISTEDEVPLDKLFATQPELLGETVKETFHQLPYLFKVLDVKEMLSIQVHPTKEEAEIGFDLEENRGVPLNAPRRNYKDRNHKPEVMIALSDFWLLHGFKSSETLKQTLNQVPQFRSLLPIFEKEGYKGLYSYVMELPQPEVDAMLLPLVQKELRRRSFHESEKNEPGYWVGEYYLNKETKNIDKGIFSIYFFNIVYLKQGQGIFQDAGIPHAYLQGQNIELMANSDNVLRAGLTNKHIDVDELIKHTRFEAVVPNILTGEAFTNEQRFNLPVRDFAVAKIRLNGGETYSNKTSAPEIFICMEGSATVSSANKINTSKGEAFIVFADNEYSISADHHIVLYKASVP